MALPIRSGRLDIGMSKVEVYREEGPFERDGQAKSGSSQQARNQIRKAVQRGLDR